MKIHTLQIPPEGLHLEGEEEGDLLNLNDEAVHALSPARYDIEVGLSDGGLFATGRLSMDVELQCVSCLESFPYTVEVPEFAVQVPLEGAEMVDLTPLVREDILLSLPAYPHCDWAGNRSCKGSLLLKAHAEPPAGPAWEELDKLKLDKRK